MKAVSFPASATSSLMEGYCQDFDSFAADFANTIEQVSARGIDITDCRESLEVLGKGLHRLAEMVDHLMLGEPVPAFDPQKKVSEVQEDTQAPPGSIGDCTFANGDQDLEGDNRDQSLLPACQHIGRKRKSGILYVTIMDEELGFEFANGVVQHTTSTRCPPDERLGEILVALGFATHKQLTPVLAKAMAGDGSLGNLVLESKIVSTGQLLEALERQVQMRFRRATMTELATYRFEERPCAMTDGRVHITPFELSWQQQRDEG